MPAVVRGLVERRLPELVVAGVAGHHHVSHAPPAFRCFPGRCADARLPAYPRLTWPKLVAEWAALRFIIEQGYGHSGDHALAGRKASTATLRVTGGSFGAGSYCPVAAWNLTTSSAGTRPRSLTSMPCALAHSRTSVLSGPDFGVLRPLRAGPRLPLPVRRAALTYGARASRRRWACSVFRSISYSEPSSPKRTVPSASPPSRSSMKIVWT
jgi:hypothetical protein